MAKNRSNKRGNKVGRNASRTDESRATGHKRRPSIKKKKAAQPTSGRRSVKGPAVAQGTVEGARPSSDGRNKGNRAEKAAGPKPASRLRLVTTGDSELLDQWRESVVNQIRTEVVRSLDDQLEQSREEVHALRRDLPIMITDCLQNFFRRGDVPLATRLSPPDHGDNQSFDGAHVHRDNPDDQDAGQHDRSAGNAAGGHKSSANSNETASLAETEANYTQLRNIGKACRQLPLRLLLKMYRAGAIAGTGPNGEDDPAKGFVWNDAPQKQGRTLRKHRDVLESLRFIHIPQRIPISKEARTGKAQRKNDAAKGGYITAKAVDVCEHIIKHGLEKSLNSKSRLTTGIK